MKPRLALILLFALPVLIAACGGSDGGSSTSADATFDAALDDARQTPVTDDLREYAQQLCDPMVTFLTDAGDTITKLDAQATEQPTAEDLEDAFAVFVDLFADLQGPFETLRDDLNDVDPPEDLKKFHEDFLHELDALQDLFASLEEEGLSALFAMPTEAPSAEEPPGFEAALLQECGDDLRDLMDEFGEDFFDDGFFGNGGDDIISIGDSDETATPPPPGQIGEATRSLGFELTVNSFVDSYSSDDPTFQPPSGSRWVLLDVSLKNVSDETKDYGSFDFTLRDSSAFSYDPTYIGQSQDLSFGSLQPDETIRGTLGFELPVDASVNRLVFEPGFSGEGRIDIDLR